MPAGGTPRRGWSNAIGACFSPWERGRSPFLPKSGAAGCVSAQALQQRGRAASSDSRSRSLAECDKMLSQSFWKFGPTCEVEEGEKPLCLGAEDISMLGLLYHEWFVMEREIRTFSAGYRMKYPLIRNQH